METIVNQSLLLGNGSPTRVCIESVSAQQYLIDIIINTHQLPVESFHPGGEDKKARLIAVSGFIKSGRVVFPKKGCETLITQMLNIGHEKHEDLCDALVMLIISVFKKEDGPRITIPSILLNQPKPLSNQEAKKQADLDASNKDLLRRSNGSVLPTQQREVAQRIQKEKEFRETPEYKFEAERLKREMNMTVWRGRY